MVVCMRGQESWGHFIILPLTIGDGISEGLYIGELFGHLCF